MLKQSRKNKQTKTTIEIYDGKKDPHLDTTNGRFVLVCIDHGFICNFHHIKSARKWAITPAEWCDGCKEMISSK